MPIDAASATAAWPTAMFSSSIEEIVGRDPAVGQVAVIGRPDEKWGERPVLIVEPRSGQSLDTAALLQSLRGKVADWWIPDDVAFVDELPHTATGKLLKTKLREDFKDYRLPTAE